MLVASTPALAVKSSSFFGFKQFATNNNIVTSGDLAMDDPQEPAFLLSENFNGTGRTLQSVPRSTGKAFGAASFPNTVE